MQGNKSSEVEPLSPRKPKRKNQIIEPDPPRNYLQQLARLLLPPLLRTILAFLFRIIVVIIKFVVGSFRNTKELGQSSQQFHKRRYQQEVEDLDVEQDQLGFTNQVLFQEGKKTVNFFLPTYVTCKIKSIQDVSVQALTGNISCALIVNVKYGDIPDEIVDKLESSIIMQLNCGEAMILKHDGLCITVKRNQKQKFLIFTIRKVFLAFMIQDTLWSPFELLELVISLTFNTVTIPPDPLYQVKENTGYQPKKEYKVSFNCMRNSDVIPISFALDCVYGVYDLAERKLETYHSKFGTLKEIQKNHEEHEKKKKKKSKKSKGEKEKKEKKEEKQKKEKKEEENTLKINQPSLNLPKYQKGQTMKFIQAFAEGAVRRLSMRITANQIKPPPKKVKYFQYTHLVIPLYKYPGNGLVTIFLPVLLLALLSLAIFFQEPQLSGRIGSIATMFLGYIALIPSIKEQLPPSAKLTVIEALVYLETICCMLCLYESFMIRTIKHYEFQWQSNYTFLTCLAIHSGVFLFVLILYCIHKLKWQPNYNYDEKIPEVKPVDCHISWDNPYCDQVFIKYNNEVLNNQTMRNKDEKLIKPYVNPTLASSVTLIETAETPQIDIIDEKGKTKTKGMKNDSAVSFSLFEDVIKQKQKPESKTTRLSNNKKIKMTESIMSEQTLLKVPTSPRSMSEFVFPDEQLYHKKII